MRDALKIYIQLTRCGTAPNAKNRRLELVFSSSSMAKCLVTYKHQIESFILLATMLKKKCRFSGNR